MGYEWYMFIHRHAQNSDNGGRPVFFCWQCWRVQDLSSWCLVRFMSRDAEAVHIREGESQQIPLRIWYSTRICELNKAQHWSYSSYRKTTVWIHPWVYKTFPKKKKQGAYSHWTNNTIYTMDLHGDTHDIPSNVSHHVMKISPPTFFGRPFVRTWWTKTHLLEWTCYSLRHRDGSLSMFFQGSQGSGTSRILSCLHSVSWISKEKIRIWVGFLMIFAWRNHIFLQRLSRSILIQICDLRWVEEPERPTRTTPLEPCQSWWTSSLKRRPGFVR